MIAGSSGGDLDLQVRLRAFAFLDAQTRLFGSLLPRQLLLRGFDFEGTRLPLMSPQGIFKPAILSDAALSVTTVPTVEGKQRPYDDAWDESGLVRYRYRGTDPRHRDNIAFRRAMERKLPLIYFSGVVPGRYEPVWPVYVIQDDQGALTFLLQADARPAPGTIPEPGTEDRRRYVTVETRQWLHQHAFRVRVIRAYRERCAVCRLHHAELLDAAHILPDTHPEGKPIVPNGLALCTLHHAAFDRNLIGVRPDLVVQVRRDILDEADGPILQHGLQEIHGQGILVPHAPPLRPSPALLEERFEWFRKAS